MDFATILKQGQRKFASKDTEGKWGRCEYCDERRKLFPYYDNKNELWNICNDCIDLFVEEEE